MESPLENRLKYDILLASHSPRRRELLEMLNVRFKIADGIEVDETYPEQLAPEEVPSYLSRKKSEAYQAELTDSQLVITADTIVIIDNEILGKPESPAQAKEMLRKLSGRTHKVVTGVTLASIEKMSTFSVSTAVEFAPLSQDVVDYYVDTFKPLDKAGAYGIQEWIGAVGIRGIHGSYYNVMGLPVHRLYNELLRF
ncbi:MAG: Maf family nucleotide pyrophosphatase [Muribaculum sp.]|nr:Maf family nucleotide pyrophosphatase [Muribaculum sp.]